MGAHTVTLVGKGLVEWGTVREPYVDTRTSARTREETQAEKVARRAVPGKSVTREGVPAQNGPSSVGCVCVCRYLVTKAQAVRSE